MKALSLTQPWAQLVVMGEKEFETRSWRTGYTERIAIHASKRFPRAAKDQMGHPYYRGALPGYTSLGIPLGAIIGTVEIVYMMRTEEIAKTLSEKEIAFGDYGLGRWAWELKEPEMFDSPIPCRGHLGMWNVPEEMGWRR